VSSRVLCRPALFLKDLTFINDGNADTTADHKLNLEKLELQVHACELVCALDDIAASPSPLHHLQGRQLLNLQEWQKSPFTLGFVCDQVSVIRPHKRCEVV
jgi:hypothetical protein